MILAEPSLAVQIALTAALADLGTPVFDEVKANRALPYVQSGDDQVVPTPAEGFDRSVEVNSTLHVYTSRIGGRRQAKTVAGAIVDRLDNVALDLGPDWTLNTIQHAGTRLLDDPDGSFHAVVTFRALLDPA